MKLIDFGIAGDSLARRLTYADLTATLGTADYINADPSISPQLQEVLYRALERDPQNRYARAREFAHDLQRLDQVGVEDRIEIREWSRRKSHMSRQIVYYGALALIPVVILLLMVLVARHR